MLSYTHAIFCGLQATLYDALVDLSSNIDPRLKAGLIKAHMKLGQYYYWFDQSPYYC